MAEFIAGLRYDAIPDEVRERIKLLILDSLGCAIFGAEMEWSRILMETLGGLDDSRNARVWGTAMRLSAPHAVLVNGALVQSFELDDVHRQGVLHVGAVTLPPLFAVAEMRPGMTGRDFLTAAVAGYEIGPRVGMCMGQEHIVQGWHSGATVGVFSAAAGAAAGLKLPAEKTVHALGIAGTQAAGLMAAQFGAMVKRMHAGRSAQSGFYAAILAEKGFTGIVDVFENPYGGFCTTFSRSSDRFNREELTSGLGTRFETLRISLKFYSCVSTNHTAKPRCYLQLCGPAALSGRRDVRQNHGPQFRGHARTCRLAVQAPRHDGGAAQHVLLPRDATGRRAIVSIDQFAETMLADPERLALAAAGYGGGRTPPIARCGSKFRHMVHVAVHLPMARCWRKRWKRRAAAKALRVASSMMWSYPGVSKLVSRRLAPTHAERIVDMVLNLDKLIQMDELIGMLALA